MTPMQEPPRHPQLDHPERCPRRGRLVPRLPTRTHSERTRMGTRHRQRPLGRRPPPRERSLRHQATRRADSSRQRSITTKQMGQLPALPARRARKRAPAHVVPCRREGLEAARRRRRPAPTHRCQERRGSRQGRCQPTSSSLVPRQFPQRPCKPRLDQRLQRLSTGHARQIRPVPRWRRRRQRGGGRQRAQ